ncbi:MAG: hypothetical protein AAFQ82_22245, partial [Myxococcota bacterium]
MKHVELLGAQLRKAWHERVAQSESGAAVRQIFFNAPGFIDVAQLVEKNALGRALKSLFKVFGLIVVIELSAR